MSFGIHATFDVSEFSDISILSDLSSAFDFLNDLPELINMTRITVPYVFPYSGLVPADSGITGVCILAESHVSLHHFDQKDYSFIDVFSCNYFDEKIVENYIREKLGATKVITKVVERGIDFPRG